jgi:hypothetical protein
MEGEEEEGDEEEEETVNCGGGSQTGRRPGAEAGADPQ